MTINLKKFSIYEFELNIDGKEINVTYKKDEVDSSNSIVVVDYGENKLNIPVNLLTSLHDALNEIDPYSFAFSDLEED